MRIPSGDERKIAHVLLKEMPVSDDLRAILRRIERGDAVHAESFALLRSLAEGHLTHLAKLLGKRLR